MLNASYINIFSLHFTDDDGEKKKINLKDSFLSISFIQIQEQKKTYFLIEIIQNIIQ